MENHIISEPAKFTAKFVIEHYLRIGRNTEELYVGVADGKQVNFTKLPEY